MDDHRNEQSWLSKLGWLVFIWSCSVAALGAAAWLIRLLMKAGGLTTGNL